MRFTNRVKHCNSQCPVESLTSHAVSDLRMAEMYSYLVGFLLEAEYSTFSGLVANVAVGSRQQRIRVGLDFLATESIVYAKQVCPLFVSECYDVLESLVVEQLSEKSVGDWGSGYLARDLVVIGGERNPGFEFRLLTGLHPSDIKIRETAGVISLAKSSALVHGRIIMIKADYTGVIAQDIDLSHSDVPGTEIMSVVGAGWDIPAEFLVDGIEVAGITFDPSAQDIWLPGSNRAAIESVIGDDLLIRKDVLYVNCVRSLDLRVSLPSGDSIQIPFILVEYSAEITASFSIHRNGCRYCPLRLKFSETLSRAVIGRQLLWSIDSAILDYPRSSVRLVPRVVERSDLVPFVSNLYLPSFSPPLVSADGITFRLATGITEKSLMLSRRLPVRIPEISLATAWVFLKHPFDLIDTERPVVHTLVEGLFSGVSLHFADAALFVQLVGPTPSRGERGLQVIMSDFPDKLEVRICERKAEDMLVPIARLGLSDPEILTPQEEARPDCAICIGGLSAGQNIQRITGCGHSFHFACIKEWLETRSRTCPCCRRCV